MQKAHSLRGPPGQGRLFEGGHRSQMGQPKRANEEGGHAAIRGRGAEGGQGEKKWHTWPPSTADKVFCLSFYILIEGGQLGQLSLPLALFARRGPTSCGGCRGAVNSGRRDGVEMHSSGRFRRGGLRPGPRSQTVVIEANFLRHYARAREQT
jgi:hypothetical protein